MFHPTDFPILPSVDPSAIAAAAAIFHQTTTPIMPFGLMLARFPPCIASPSFLPRFMFPHHPRPQITTAAVRSATFNPFSRRSLSSDDTLKEVSGSDNTQSNRISGVDKPSADMMSANKTSDDEVVSTSTPPSTSTSLSPEEEAWQDDRKAHPQKQIVVLNVPKTSHYNLIAVKEEPAVSTCSRDTTSNIRRDDEEDYIPNYRVKIKEEHLTTGMFFFVDNFVCKYVILLGLDRGLMHGSCQIPGAFPSSFLSFPILSIPSLPCATVLFLTY